MTSLKAAVVQAAAAVFDLEASLEKLARLAGEVSAGGARTDLQSGVRRKAERLTKRE